MLLPRRLFDRVIGQRHADFKVQCWDSHLFHEGDFCFSILETDQFGAVSSTQHLGAFLDHQGVESKGHRQFGMRHRTNAFPEELPVRFRLAAGRRRHRANDREHLQLPSLLRGQGSSRPLQPLTLCASIKPVEKRRVIQRLKHQLRKIENQRSFVGGEKGELLLLPPKEFTSRSVPTRRTGKGNARGIHHAQNPDLPITAIPEGAGKGLLIRRPH